MPVIVAPTSRGVWLPGAESAGPGEERMHVHPDVRHLLARQVIAAGAADLIAIPVGPRVNSPAFDDEEVLRPAADPHRL